jgi:hypothetical protein
MQTMATVKDIKIKVIPSNVANDFIRKHHYSGKVVPNSQLHFGAFLNNTLHGVMSFGPSINKKGTINLVKNTKWNEFVELNRMAFDDQLPKNSESRCIAIAIKLIKKNAPHIKWIISFADGSQCGDGTIYRASGFKLVEIRENEAIRRNPKTGELIHAIQAHHLKITNSFRDWEAISGFQLKYVYLIDKNMELSRTEMPFSMIDEFNAGMYKGEKIKLSERKSNYNKQESDVSHLSA